MAKIEAYNSAGELQTIPEHWLAEKHPAFKFTKTPPRTVDGDHKAAKADNKKEA